MQKTIILNTSYNKINYMIDEFEIKLNWLIIRKHYYDVTILISGTSVIIPSV